MHTKAKLALLSLVLIFILSVVAVAQAKVLPYVEPVDGDWGDTSDPFQVENGMYLSLFYGRLESDNDIDALALNIEKPLKEMAFEISIPECGDRFATFYPAIALIGPGLDTPDAEVLETLPFDLPDGLGMAVFLEETRPISNKVRRATATEGISAAYYTDTKRVQLEIPEAGEYMLVLWEPDGHAGAYSLWTGGEHPNAEQFPSDQELTNIYNLVENNSWMGWDCAEVLAANR